MITRRGMSWLDAFLASPGPRSAKSAAVLFFKGLCMGSADIIPGVSGGTIALITGIYEKLLKAVKSVDMGMARKLLALDLRGAVARVHLRFLLCVFSGIGVAIISLSRLMNHLLHQHAVLTWSLFLGLISASILVVGRRVEHWFGRAFAWFWAGAGVAHFLVNLMPVATPENPAFIFLCGVLAICAMILPGLSGAFILLILGKYEYITACLKNPFDVYHLTIICIFCSGCLAGLLCFSRVLTFLLDRYHNRTLSFLTGLMAGCLQKIWPWKQVLDVSTVDGRQQILWGGNIMPHTLDAQLVAAVGLILAGFAAVLALEKLSRSSHTQ